MACHPGHELAPELATEACGRHGTLVLKALGQGDQVRVLPVIVVIAHWKMAEFGLSDRASR